MNYVQKLKGGQGSIYFKEFKGKVRRKRRERNKRKEGNLDEKEFDQYHVSVRNVIIAYWMQCRQQRR